MTTRLIPYDDAWDAAVGAFFESARAHDPLLPRVSRDAWRRYTQAPWTNHGRAFSLAINGAQCVALLTSFIGATGPAIRHLRIIVHPLWRNRGLGRQLFDEVQRIEPRPAGWQTVLPAGWTVAERFYGRRGFVCVQEEIEMEAAAPILIPPTSAAITPATPGDCAALAGLHNEAYHQTFAFRLMTEADMALALGADGASFLVAREGGGVTGYCHTERTGAGLRVESLVVSHAHRRSGLGKALLLRACADAVGATASLTVDEDNAGARALYVRCGFHEVSRTRRLRRLDHGEARVQA